MQWPVPNSQFDLDADLSKLQLLARDFSFFLLVPYCQSISCYFQLPRWLHIIIKRTGACCCCREAKKHNWELAARVLFLLALKKGLCLPAPTHHVELGLQSRNWRSCRASCGLQQSPLFFVLLGVLSGNWACCYMKCLSLKRYWRWILMEEDWFLVGWLIIVRRKICGGLIFWVGGGRTEFMELGWLDFVGRRELIVYGWWAVWEDGEGCVVQVFDLVEGIFTNCLLCLPTQGGKLLREWNRGEGQETKAGAGGRVAMSKCLCKFCATYVWISFLGFLMVGVGCSAVPLPQLHFLENLCQCLLM